MREKSASAVAFGIRHGDMVRIMAGRSKGKSGKVLSVNRVKGTVTVEHANIIKRHTRPNPAKQIKGGIAEKESSIHISNVMVLTSGGVPTRISYKVEGDRRTRVARKTGELLEKK